MEHLIIKRQMKKVREKLTDDLNRTEMVLMTKTISTLALILCLEQLQVECRVIQLKRMKKRPKMKTLKK